MFDRLRKALRPSKGRGRIPAADTAAAEAFLVSGLTHQAEGRLPEAIESLRRSLALGATNAELYRQLCLAYAQSGQMTNANVLLKQGIEQYPDHEDLHFLAGNLQLHANLLQDALASFGRALAIQPKHAEAHHNHAVALRRLNRTAEALESYEAAVNVRDDYESAWVGRGDLLVELSRNAEALASYDRALQINPGLASVLLSRGNVLANLERPNEALASFEAALKIDPAFAEAHFNRGNVLVEFGRHEDALASYGAALESRVDFVSALGNRGNLFLKLERPAEALLDFDHAIRVDPSLTEMLNYRASALHKLDRLTEALATCEQALRLRPEFTDALLKKGNLLRALKRPVEALVVYEQLLGRSPGQAGLHNDSGLLLHEAERFDEALAAYDEALRLSPDFVAALNNRGLVLQSLMRFEEALRDLDKALQLDRKLAGAHVNRGNVLRELGRHQDALLAYGEARRLDPEFEEFHFNEGLSQLVLGDLSSGWPKYELRWKDKRLTYPISQFTEPLWLGRESLFGKTILLHAEQGLGDTIQFCRYAKSVAALGAKVLLAVQPPLESLLAEVEGVTRLIPKGEELPAFDFQCPLLSLPLAFDTSLDSIPNSHAYIGTSEAHRERAEAWDLKLGPKTLPRIGLVWSGNFRHKNDANRSIPLSRFVEILSGDAEYFCLQNELRDSDRELLRSHPEIAYRGKELTSFAETAALIANLDLVVCVDTSVAHLSGAMGKPTWLLLPANPDWRWLLERDDSPWYPTVRLFRQSGTRNWDDVLARAAVALREFVV